MKTTAAFPASFWSTFPSLLLQAVVTLAGVTVLTAADPAPAPPAEKNATPIITSDETVMKHLVELDRLLDAPGSKLEEMLRKNLDRIEEETALNIPELEVVMKEQPWIVPTLKTERHFLLHRYIARRARGPLLRPDIIALDKFLAEHSDIRRPLNRDPSQIVDANFLIAHPSLADFFGQHPVLSTALLIPQSGRRAETKTK